ncbi:peptide chain release factor 1 [Prevotella melaninogenica]|jgi:hypothetical protein|uniref:peptide chain release factor 1 n=1 Tax=Prevotella melaninogenica TaxID=28132 RepID=UPI001CB246EE|nr:peptide chain release factor 1 [Prevotella melaninogenica]MBF1604690.1 peptide chain release factor 1 [Prevotella sp.]UEA99166.1 peptide chain release factor 1 [Prevotella melaninogenica]
MKDNIKKELEALIQEQRDRIPKLKREVGAFAYYVYESSVKEGYIKWRENAKRFLEINFTGDSYIDDFKETCDKKITPNQQNKLLAILEAFEKYPQVIERSKMLNQSANINIHSNISNTNTQNQSQSQEIKILLNCLEDELSVKQLKELKQVVDEEKGDLEKAKPKVIDKIKSFGENVASNILANIITNPAIWSCLG